MVLAVAKNENAEVITSSPGPMSSAMQRQNQRIGARSTADRVARVAVSGGLLFESRDIFAENERLRGEDAVDGLVNLRSDCFMLGDQIDERYARGVRGMRGLTPGDSHGAAPGNTKK